MVRFICPTDPGKATVATPIDSAAHIYSTYSNWKKIEERLKFVKENKLKAEKAQKKDPMKVIKSKTISKDPPKPVHQAGLHFKRNIYGDSKAKFLRKETYPDNAKEMKTMSAE